VSTQPSADGEPIKTGSLDDLDDVQKAKRKYRFDNQLEDALDYIRKNMPITGFSGLLGEDLWLREVMKDLEQPDPCKFCKSKVTAARSKALQLFGEWLGVLGNKSKKKSKRDVVFDEGD
jgi:hypothetical protein